MQFKMFSTMVVAGTAVMLPAPAEANYSLTPLSGGLSTLEVAPGETFTLDLLLMSDAGDQHLSSEFELLFSQPGLMYLDYSWGTGYTTGGIDDVSAPFIEALSMPINANSYDGPGDIDIFFSNLTDDGEVFAEGLLTSLTLMVPVNWDGANSVTISAIPELFFDGFVSIPTLPGPAFTLNIPAPASSGCLVVLLALSRRLRHRNASRLAA